MVTLTFTGSDDLVKAMSALSADLRQEALYAVLAEAGAPFRQQLDELAPRGKDEPHIAGNIVMKKVTKVSGVPVASGAAAVAIGPTRKVRQAPAVEFGFTHTPDGKHIPPRSYARRAFEQGKDQAHNTIGRGLWDLITGRGRSTTSGLL
jgi:HK97 gp10 family phage protein